jgi:predicted ArsR family transcriptional regulator
MDEETGTRQHSVVRLSGQQIRTLAHPLRSRLLGALRVDGPATATTLARLLQTNTGATSYHLRQLAEVGLVVEETGQNTGKQRFWRSAHDASTWKPTDFDDDPDARAAAEWIEGHQLQLLTEQAEQWFGAKRDAPREWREVASLNDAVLTVSPARLRELNDEIWQLVTRYYGNEALADEEGAAQVHVFVASFPRAEELR